MGAVPILKGGLFYLVPARAADPSAARLPVLACWEKPLQRREGAREAVAPAAGGSPQPRQVIRRKHEQPGMVEASGTPWPETAAGRGRVEAPGGAQGPLPRGEDVPFKGKLHKAQQRVDCSLSLLLGLELALPDSSLAKEKHVVEGISPNKLRVHPVNSSLSFRWTFG